MPAVPAVPVQELPRRIFPLLDYFASLGFSLARQRGLMVRAPVLLCYSLSKVQVCPLASPSPLEASLVMQYNIPA